MRGSVFNIVDGNTLTITDTGFSSLPPEWRHGGRDRTCTEYCRVSDKAITFNVRPPIDVVTNILSTGVVNPLAGAIDFGFSTSNHGLMQIGSECRGRL